MRNTNYSDDLFHVAKIHPGLMIPFTFNVVKYNDMILSKMNRYGINPLEHKPLVTFRFAMKLPHIDVDEKDFIPLKSKQRYLNALDQIEQEGAKLVTTNQ
jgi:hypothetical protein